MSRPTRFEEFRYLGDKRKQVVYDLDTDDAGAQEAIAELLASERFAAFAPDTLAEARNRGYHPHASAPPTTPEVDAFERGRRLDAGSASAGSASTLPLSRPSKATSESAGSLGSDAGSSGRPCEVDPRRAAAVGVVPRHRDRLEQAVHPQRQHPQRIALLPAQAGGGVVVGPDQLRRDGVELLGLGDGRELHDVGPALDRDRLADRGRVARGRSSGGTAPSAAPPSGARRWGRARSGSPAPRSGGRPRGARPCARRGSAHPRAARGRPTAHSLQAGCHVPTIGGPWTTPSCPETSSCPPTWRSRTRPCRASASCSATDFPNPPRGAATVGTTYPDLADHIANEAGWTVLTFNFRGTGTSEGDFSARRLARRSAQRGAHAARACPTCAACGSRASVTAGRSRCAQRPTTIWSAGWRRSRRRARCVTGRRIPVACSCTHVRWA